MKKVCSELERGRAKVHNSVVHIHDDGVPENQHCVRDINAMR